MFKKLRFSLICVIFSLICVISSLISVIGVFAQEQITITTYYPSPYGSYRELEVTGSITLGQRNSADYFNIPNSCGGYSLTGVRSGIWGRDYSAGCGDEWYIAWYPRSGENSTLEIAAKNDGSDHIALMPTGNVGIGTIAPLQILHAYGGSEILSTGSGAGFKFRNRETPGLDLTDTWVWYSSGNVARFWRSGVGDLIGITTTGNVGIGTTDPMQRLQVMGNMVLAGSCIGDDGHIIHHNGTGNMYVGRTSGGNCGWPAGWAYLSPGGVWTDQSSRASKDNIRDLSEDEAIAAVMKLQPVKFNYKNHNGEEYVGFIAEDVPDLVASEDRKGLSPMDIVAVLTKVVQQQQKEIKGLKAQLNERAAKTGSELF